LCYFVLKPAITRYKKRRARIREKRAAELRQRRAAGPPVERDPQGDAL
jgi:hypothetical protein